MGNRYNGSPPILYSLFLFPQIMNYLGHLYFSGNNVALMQANLYGDFIKGSKLDHLPDIIQQGIQLHRRIDDYIDHHPVVHELLVLLRPELPKVAGIAVDIYFDHLLAKNWKQFHAQKLSDYLKYVYSHFDLEAPDYSPEFRSFLSAMIRYDWMSHYPNVDAIDKMCRGVSTKLSFENALVHGKTVFVMYEKEIEACFFEYMSAANEHFLPENFRIMS